MNLSPNGGFQLQLTRRLWPFQTSMIPISIRTPLSLVCLVKAFHYVQFYHISLIQSLTVEDDSPYPEVRSAVANTDDPDIPVSTLRSWVIGAAGWLWLSILRCWNPWLMYRDDLGYHHSCMVLTRHFRRYVLIQVSRAWINFFSFVFHLLPSVVYVAQTKFYFFLLTRLYRSSHNFSPSPLAGLGQTFFLTRRFLEFQSIRVPFQLKSMWVIYWWPAERNFDTWYIFRCKWFWMFTE